MKKKIFFLPVLILVVFFSIQFGVRKNYNDEVLRIGMIHALADEGEICSYGCITKPNDCCFQCDICDVLIGYDESDYKASRCIKIPN